VDEIQVPAVAPASRGYGPSRMPRTALRTDNHAMRFSSSLQQSLHALGRPATAAGAMTAVQTAQRPLRRTPVPATARRIASPA
jgi:hypothetical protein